jgi:hypothetical protein
MSHSRNVTLTCCIAMDICQISLILEIPTELFSEGRIKNKVSVLPGMHEAVWSTRCTCYCLANEWDGRFNKYCFNRNFPGYALFLIEIIPGSTKFIYLIWLPHFKKMCFCNIYTLTRVCCICKTASLLMGVLVSESRFFSAFVINL